VTTQRLLLIGGGTRSGKSDFALAQARRLGRRRLFVATARAGDTEMAERIRLHRRTRGDDFDTLEEPLTVPESVCRATGCDVILLDCLTLWLANLLLEGLSPDEILGRVAALSAALRGQPAHAVVVTSEVGLGLVPETPLGRTFRDVAGLAHQRLAAAADEVYFAVLGVVLRLRPGPVVAVTESL
jgi:adenosylcobinamide kinase/adenosylcobinamide-phosphate guanylyltransferase